MERISKFQLGAMIILFQIGSTPLFELGIKASQDAWLVVITSLLLGLMLLFLFLAIQRREPDKNLGQLLIQYFGSYLGKLILMLYILMFTYESMRNVRDFGDLTLLTILPRGPISIVMLIMLTLSIYAIYKGIEVIFRFAEFLLIGVLAFYLILLFMQIVSGVVYWGRLLPILENGIQPILKESVTTFWFPFGQMIIFLMFWNYLSEKKGMAKTSIRSYFVSGAVILLWNIMILLVLGSPLAAISTVPLLQAVQLIQIAVVFERFDALVILLFYTGILIKATLWYLAAVLGLSQLFNTDYRRFIIPVGAIIYVVSFVPRSWQAHLEIGTIVAEQFKVNVIFIGVIPAILFIVMLIRGRLVK